jgi:hypothetical protein
MKRLLIACVLTAASFAAYGADSSNATGTNQSNVQSSNVQSQTTTTLDKSKTASADAEHAQAKDHDAWSQLNQGWKQFETTGK